MASEKTLPMIPQNVPELGGNEKQYVLDCLESNWLSSSGPYVTKFEESFARYCGLAHGVACSSGTAALHIALLAAGIGPGDEVIVPDFTLIADANMVLLCGAKPVFVDVEEKHWCIDPAQVKEKITEKTKAILCVHMFGHPCQMDLLREIAETHSVVLIEDAAQAHGSRYRETPAGALGDISCFSFYATKTLASGEGGIVLTDSTAYADSLRALRSHGFEGAGRNYTHARFGMNYRLTNLQAAIALAQVEQLDDKAQRKREVFAKYRELLEGLPGIRLQQTADEVESTYWNVVVVLEETIALSAAEVREQLAEKGVQTRMLFQPLHSQPVYQQSSAPGVPVQGVPVQEALPDCSGAYPVSTWLATRGISLPSSVGLSTEEIHRVVESLKGVLEA